jgi:hypothetical protein
MEEPEVPLERLHEHVHETAEHSGEAWISWVALSTAILAVLGAVAMFQIAIAVAAISALTRKRHFWIVSLLFGVAGCIFLALGMLNLHWHELLRNH